MKKKDKEAIRARKRARKKAAARPYVGRFRKERGLVLVVCGDPEAAEREMRRQR